MPPRQGNLARGRSSATFLLGACASAVVLYTCFTTSPGGSLRREPGRLQSYVALKDGKGEDVKERKLGTFWDPSEVTFKPYEVPERRADIGKLLELEKMEVGAELGVQTGLFANITLTNWKSCRKYVMIDLWRRIPGNYVDHGNADDGIQSYNYWRTRETTAHFKDRVQLMYLPMFTIEAADLFPDEHFDYVYVDARHDKCGVTEDLNKWWPKLKQGGFFAGHDMVFAHEVNGQDWSLCEDGTRDPGAVKGAVMEFALKHELKFETIYGGEQPSWILRKPVLRSVQG